MRSPFVTGLLHPLNLAMLGLAVLAGLAAAWWLLPLGLLLWLVMVLAVSRDPSLRFSHEMHQREPIAQRFQPYFDRIERSQVSVFNSLSMAPGRTRKALQPVQEEMEVLTDQVYRLCRRMTALENYRLVSESNSNLQADLQQIDEAIDKAGDLLVKQQYEESRRTLLERMAKQKLVASDLDQMEAQLLGLVNEMDGVVTEVIRLQAAGPPDAERGVPALVGRIREQTTQLEKSEQEAVEV
jgi:flagellar biosynthesis chaperone FliJ